MYLFLIDLISSEIIFTTCLGKTYQKEILEFINKRKTIEGVVYKEFNKSSYDGKVISSYHSITNT